MSDYKTPTSSPYSRGPLPPPNNFPQTNGNSYSMAPAQPYSPPSAYPPASHYPPAANSNGYSNPTYGNGNGNGYAAPAAAPAFHANPGSAAANETRPQQQLDMEEEEMLRKGLVDWDVLRKKETWMNKGMIKWYILGVFAIAIVALMVFEHKNIVKWLTPVGNYLRSIKAGWLIAVAIVFVLSFPPLFGNEIVLVLIGLIWGLGEGFGIAAMGTILGEVANFIVFKYWCRGRAEKIEHKSLNYACLSRVLRDGGFLMCFVSRLSALPTHFTTIVFAVSGFSFWLYCLGLVASLPKQLVVVYVGVVLAQESTATGTSTKDRTISYVVWAVTAVVTIGAAWWIWVRMQKVRVEVWREHRAYLASKGIAASDLPPDVDARGEVIRK